MGTAVGEMPLIDTIKNPELLLGETPDLVAEACHGAIDSGVRILSPEYAVHPTAPLKTLHTLVEVAEGKL